MIIRINYDFAKFDLATVFDRLDPKTVLADVQDSSQSLLGIHPD
jgi:hypothetical protein